MRIINHKKTYVNKNKKKNKANRIIKYKIEEIFKKILKIKLIKNEIKEETKLNINAHAQVNKSENIIKEEVVAVKANITSITLKE